jgi:hypothetical protein
MNVYKKNCKEIKMIGNPDRHSCANKARRIRREEIQRIHDQRYSIIPRIPTRHDLKNISDGNQLYAFILYT